MCFSSDERDPDIWLVVENGRYVPAPPLVYVPGLRQIQDRLHRKGYEGRSQLPCESGLVPLPISSTTQSLLPTISACAPASPDSDSPPTCTMPVALEESITTLTAPPTTGEHVTLVAAEEEGMSSVAYGSSEAPHQEAAEEPPNTSAEAQEAVQSENANPPDTDITSLGDCTDSTISNDPPLSSSTSSSLRSILKKKSSAESNATDPEEGAEADKRDDENVDNGPEKSQHKKNKKTVSFSEDVATVLPSSNGRAATQTTAAKAGAAIAKKLVEMNSPSRSLRKPKSNLGGGQGSVDSGHGIRDSTEKANVICLDPGIRGNRKETKRLGQRRDAHSRGQLASDRARREQPGRAGLASFMPYNDNCMVDDEIPSKCP